jgi:cytoskeletal protein CcmA (bactofilin family)
MQRRREIMFFRRRRTIIPEDSKIKGDISAKGLVEVNGHFEGEVHCRSLFVSSKGRINGDIEAERVAVNGRVEGSIRGSEVVLKSRAHVVGDIQHRCLSVEPGAYFEGRVTRPSETNVRKASDGLIVRLESLNELAPTREPEDVSAA